MQSRARSAPPAADQPWRWSAAGALAGALLALALFAPARWLADWVRQASAGHVLLAEPRGTLWDGSAELVLAGGADSRDAAALPGRLAWRLRPGGDGLTATFEAPCCTLPRPLALRAAPRWGGLQLTLANAQAQWPAALLAGLGTPWNTLEPEGTVKLSTQGLALEWVEGRLRLTGDASLEALQITSRLSTLRPMGSYRLTLQGGSTPSIRLDTLEGSLQLSGSGHWAGSRLRFQGVASAAPEHEAALSNLLNIIGRRSGARSIITVG